MSAVVMEKEAIYTAEQVRKILGLRTIRTVHRLIKRGELRAFTVGRDYRIRESALQEYIERKSTGGKNQEVKKPEAA